MSIEKTVKDGKVILKDEGNEIAVINGYMDNDILHINMEGMFRADVETYLHNELRFFKASGVAEIQINCEKLAGISPGCYLELLQCKVDMEFKKSRVLFVNKSEALNLYESRLGTAL